MKKFIDSYKLTPKEKAEMNKHRHSMKISNSWICHKPTIKIASHHNHFLQTQYDYDGEILRDETNQI